MKSTVRVVVFAMLVAPLLLSETLGADLRRMSQGSAMANRPKMPQTRIAPKQLLLVPLPAGSYTIGAGGYFPTIDSAFRRLEGGGIAGAVTLLLTDTLYVAPFPPGDFRLIGPIAGAGPASRITLRPADNVAVRIEGSGTGTLTFEDVSLMDIQMPVLDGYAATRAIRSWEQAQGRSPVPILALTANALQSEVQRSLEAGCTTHLTKPYPKGPPAGSHTTVFPNFRSGRAVVVGCVSRHRRVAGERRV